MRFYLSSGSTSWRTSMPIGSTSHCIFLSLFLGPFVLKDPDQECREKLPPDNCSVFWATLNLLRDTPVLCCVHGRGAAKPASGPLRPQRGGCNPPTLPGRGRVPGWRGQPFGHPGSP